MTFLRLYVGVWAFVLQLIEVFAAVRSSHKVLHLKTDKKVSKSSRWIQFCIPRNWPLSMCFSLVLRIMYSSYHVSRSDDSGCVGSVTNYLIAICDWFNGLIGSWRNSSFRKSWKYRRFRQCIFCSSESAFWCVKAEKHVSTCTAQMWVSVPVVDCK